ncbi:MAG: hypothetical protein HFG40_00060 [Bacilli bacterium]|nr:hypothetical protein [Bacilli bacterium]
MEFFVNFIIIFIVVYLAFYFVTVRKARRNSKKIPVEVQYLLIRYQIDLKKIRYRNFVHSIAIVGSIDIAFVGAVVLFVNNTFLQLLIGFVLLVPIILGSFLVLGKYYQKKTQSEDELDSEDEEELEMPIVKEKRKRVKGERRNG